MTAKNVFFDIDGTLHEGDMFVDYIRFLASRNRLKAVLLLPWLIPALLLYGFNPDRRWSLNLLLWPLTVLTSAARLKRLDDKFVDRFRRDLRPIDETRGALYRHLHEGDCVYLVSGSPEHLVSAVYADIVGRKDVHLIGSRMARSAGALLLTERCVCAEKPRMVERLAGRPVSFDVGYTDSEMDFPMLQLCKLKYRVGRDGVVSIWGARG